MCNNWSWSWTTRGASRMSFCFCMRSVNLPAKRPLIIEYIIFVNKNNFFMLWSRHLATKFLWDISVCNMQICPCPFQSRGKGIEQVFPPFMISIWEYFYWTLLCFWSSGLHRSISILEHSQVVLIKKYFKAQKNPPPISFQFWSSDFHFTTFFSYRFLISLDAIGP